MKHPRKTDSDYNLLNCGGRLSRPVFQMAVVGDEVKIRDYGELTGR